MRPAETDPDVAEDPNWAPLKYTFAGSWEIDPHEEHAEAVQILDVREPGEFAGLLGHIRGASSQAASRSPAASSAV